MITQNLLLVKPQLTASQVLCFFFFPHNFNIINIQNLMNYSDVVYAADEWEES